VKCAPDAKFYRGAGCNHCNQTGMTGRIGIFEMLRITGRLRELIPTRPSADQIIREAPSDHVGMVRDGIAKALAGITTLEEVFRVAKTIGEDD
jgi:type II secretory ATPase GspE/PulE/Tfp pilus assembly ATPase PilB-like protein